MSAEISSDGAFIIPESVISREAFERGWELMKERGYLSAGPFPVVIPAEEPEPTQEPIAP